MANQPHIAFIGTGNMARAIIGGLLANQYPADKLSATARTAGKLDDLAAQGVNVSSDNAAVIANADILVLAVKPQGMQALLAEHREQILARAPLVISVAAGLTLGTLESWLSTQTAVVRCMPNTPSLVGLGAAGLLANAITSDAQKQQAEEILKAVGVAMWVNSDDEMDTVTAISGSGPAYYFMVMEAMVAAGQKLGLSAEVARQLTLQTARGAAEMAQRSDVGPDELRRRVTSPNGTTERAIMRFQAEDLPGCFERAMEDCKARSAELAVILSGSDQ